MSTLDPVDALHPNNSAFIVALALIIPGIVFYSVQCAYHYSPLKTGFRFSLNANRASVLSLVGISVL